MTNPWVIFYGNLTIANVWSAAGKPWFSVPWLLLSCVAGVMIYMERRK